MNESIIKKLTEYLLPYINEVINDKMSQHIKTAPAVVVSADNPNKKATVKQAFSDTSMTLFNCTGKDLDVGDNVFIWWFGEQTNAWIAIKNDGQPW